MKRSLRIQVVVDLARRKAQEGARALAFVQQRLQAEQQKLGQLESYLLEYREGQLAQGRKGVSVQQFRIYNEFSGNVEKAIVQQSAQVATVTRQVEQVRRHWLTLDAKHKGLEKLLDKLRLEERAEQDRLEQKAQDEASTQRRRHSPFL
jgi:flagellar FliJ protein